MRVSIHYWRERHWALRLLGAVISVAVVSMVFGFLGAAAIENGQFEWIDWIDLSGSTLERFFSVIAWFGTREGVVVSSLLMLSILLRLRLFQAAVVFVAALLTAALAIDTLKEWVARPRPAHNGIVESGYAFPSGHTFVCTAVFGLFTWILIHHLKDSEHRRFTVALSSVFLILIAFSRLYLGVHYVSDVLAGGLLGILWAAVFGLAVESPWRS